MFQWCSWNWLQGRYWGNWRTIKGQHHEHQLWKGTVIMFHQNRFLIISKNRNDFSLLNTLTVEIEKEFDNASTSVYSGLAIISSKMVSLVYKMLSGKKTYFIC